MSPAPPRRNSPTTPHADSKQVSEEALDWSIPPRDIADVIAFAVSRPQRVTLNEILVRPTVQAM